MMDEYSDDEFAPEDTELAYEAEFGDDDDGTTDADAADENGAPCATYAMSEVYHESYDAEFDPPDAHEQPTTAATDALESYEEDAHEETHEPSDAVEKAPALQSLQRGEDMLHQSSSLLSARLTEKREGSPRLPAPVRRSSDPLMLAIPRRFSEPQITASATQIDHCVDPELLTKLTHRSSSPRMRPAPIARLHSVGELSAAAPDELEVPTNAVTEEAAAIVDVITSGSSSPVPLKRSSSLMFVPRLASVREIGSDQSIWLEDGHVDTHDGEEGDRGKDEGDDEYTDGDDCGDDGVDENVQADHSNTDNEVITTADKCTRDQHERHSENQDGEQPHSTHNRSTPRLLIVVTIDPSASETAVPGLQEAAVPEFRDKGAIGYVEASIVEAGDLNEARRAETNKDTVSGQHENVTSEERVNDVSEDVEAPGTGESGSARSTPSQLSEHILDDDADGTSHRLQQLMAEVEANEVADLEIANSGEDIDDEIDYAVGADDESRRKTHHLLQEAHALMVQQSSEAQVVQAAPLQVPAGNSESLHDLSETDPSERYRDDDQFLDSAYDDDDQEVVEGAYCDSDHDEAVLGEHPTKVSSSVSSEFKATPSETPIVVIQAATSPTPQENEQPVLPQEAAAASSTSPVNTNSSSTVKTTRTWLQPNSPLRDGIQVGDVRTRAFSQASTRPPGRPKVTASPVTTPRKPDVSKLTPKRPVPRQQAPTSRQSHRIMVASPSAVDANLKSGNEQLVRTVHLPPRQPGPKPSSPTKTEPGQVRPPSPVRECLPGRASSPCKAPVFKQKRTSRPADPNVTKKKLKPVKCPPNLRIDLPHVDKEKCEWLLLNMFRHGDYIDKYDPFMPTATPEQVIELHLPLDVLKRPLSANKILGEVYQAPHSFASRGSYGRHGGRRIVDPPVDPHKRERERNWVSSNPSVPVIPDYDSILDKYCKTVTSPVAQRRIYETRMDDLSPQLAMVLEKRAFKEWKHSESDGFGAASNAYRTAIISPKSLNASFSKTLHMPRPPASSATTTLSLDM